MRTLMLLLTAWFLLWGAPSGATVIEFVPSDQTVALGAEVSFELVVSGLGDFAEPSLGSFDLDLTYDEAILSPQSVTLTSRLGDEALGQTFEGFDFSVPGLIDLFVVSLLSQQELEALQPESFVLATFSFDALSPGTSFLELPQVLLGDALGSELEVVAGSGSITVIGHGSAVPEPSLALLLITALGLVLKRAREP